MAKLLWPMALFLVTMLATYPGTVSGTVDIFALLTTKLTPNTATNNTVPAVFDANLAQLVAGMRLIAAINVNLYNLTVYNIWNQPSKTFLTAAQMPYATAFLSLSPILPTLNQVAENIVTITNNTRYNVVTPPPVTSISNFAKALNSALNISSSLIQSFLIPTPNATDPTTFKNNLVDFRAILSQYITVAANLLQASTGINVISAGYVSFGWSLPLLNDFATQISALAKAALPPSSLADILAAITTQVGSITGLITKYVPTTTALTAPDPNWDYTCGALFADNLDNFIGLWSQAGSGLISFVNSTNNVIISGAIKPIGVILPYLVSLAGQIGVILDGLTPKYGRRLYPSQVRTNYYKADCHLRHLQRFNGRRFRW